MKLSLNCNYCNNKSNIRIYNSKNKYFFNEKCYNCKLNNICTKNYLILYFSVGNIAEIYLNLHHLDLMLL